MNKGTIVVDNSSAFRMDENVPLVIPEVNPDAMKGIRVGTGKGALIANPNCSTIICLMAATPLHRRAKVCCARDPDFLCLLSHLGFACFAV